MVRVVAGGALRPRIDAAALSARHSVRHLLNGLNKRINPGEQFC
jgi:hypothetical protein